MIEQRRRHWWWGEVRVERVVAKSIMKQVQAHTIKKTEKRRIPLAERESI